MDPGRPQAVLNGSVRPGQVQNHTQSTTLPSHSLYTAFQTLLKASKVSKTWSAGDALRGGAHPYLNTPPRTIPQSPYWVTYG